MNQCSPIGAGLNSATSSSLTHTDGFYNMSLDKKGYGVTNWRTNWQTSAGNRTLGLTGQWSAHPLKANDSGPSCSEHGFMNQQITLP